MSELETQLILARNLGYLAEKEYGQSMAKVNTTFPLIGGLLRSVRRRAEA